MDNDPPPLALSNEAAQPVRDPQPELSVDAALRYVGDPKPTPIGQEYGRRRDGLEKKPKPFLPVGLRFK